MALPPAGGDNTVQVAIIGAGFIGPVHLEALRRLGDVEVVALCDSRLETAQYKAQAPNIAHAYDSVETLLAHPGLQAVRNCTPNHLYAQINRQILAAGLHVFSEKLLCTTAEEVRELVALATRAGVVHGVSFVYRQFAVVQQAAAMIRHGEVGRIFAAHGNYLQSWMLLETDYSWWVDSAQGDASRTVADIGSYRCDIVQFMAGRRIIEVMADLSIVWSTRKTPVNGRATFSTVHEAQAYKARPVGTEGFSSVLLHFDDGSKDSLMVSQVSTGRKNRLAVEINGSLCSLAWDQEVPQRLWIGHREQPDRLLSDNPSLLRPEAAASACYPGGHTEGWPDASESMMGRFYQAVRAGKMPEVGAGARYFAAFDDDADVMYIIEAIVKSRQQQRWVSVER